MHTHIHEYVCTQAIIDSEFDAFHHHVMATITELKVAGSEFFKKLELPIASFQALAELMPFIMDLKCVAPSVNLVLSNLAKIRKLLLMSGRHFSILNAAWHFGF